MKKKFKVEKGVIKVASKRFTIKDKSSCKKYYEIMIDLTSKYADVLGVDFYDNDIDNEVIYPIVMLDVGLRTINVREDMGNEATIIELTSFPKYEIIYSRVSRYTLYIGLKLKDKE